MTHNPMKGPVKISKVSILIGITHPLFLNDIIGIWTQDLKSNDTFIQQEQIVHKLYTIFCTVTPTTV